MAEQSIIKEIPDMQSLSPMAIQRNWKTPSEFPLCPEEISTEPLFDYVSRLKFGRVFSKNSFGQSLIVVAEQGDEVLSVLCNLADNPIKEWALTKITVEDGKFVHESIRTYFTLQGALKEHCSLMNVPLDESIDDCS